MSNFFMRWVASAVSIYFVGFLFGNVYVEGFFISLLAAAILAIVNLIIKPILLVLTLPLNVLTLGLFTLVINACTLKITSMIVPNFYVEGFFKTIIVALVLSIVNMMITKVVGLDD